MTSDSYSIFSHAIQDSIDLMQNFDTLNKNPPPPEIEVLKRASLVMALAALETYFENRVTESVNAICQHSPDDDQLILFYKNSLAVDLKKFHSPSVDRVKELFQKYLDIDVTQCWSWNNCTPEQARLELNKIVKKRGDIAHRSLRPEQSSPHAVTRDDMRKYIHFIGELVKATELFIQKEIK